MATSNAAEEGGTPETKGSDAAEPPTSVLDFKVKDIDGKEVKLGDKYKGKVLVIVNTASECGYTPQYTDLQAIYKKYHEQGLEVLAFPSNDFGGQEPGTESEIKYFCSTKYNVTFPLFAKMPVKGEEKSPLYGFITDEKANPKTGGEIKWNFTKFLVDRNGEIIARYESAVKPTDESVAKAIEKALAEKPATASS
ncbi:MAG: glutathione peroxidase [Candidatus Hydrogenedentes bacterium]|nr:glutathione peroxidase [Candidatus Hydrogenedentota bacterium]